jgi:DNA polymerase-1
LSREFGFRALTERLAGLAVGSVPTDWQADYRTVASLDELKRLAGEMAKQTRLSIDTETTSTNPRWAELVGCSFAWKEGEAYYVPLRSPPGEPQVDAAAALEILCPTLESPTHKKVGQNLKYDIVVLRGAGIEVQGTDFDTMVADYVLEPGQRNHSLDDISVRYLGHTMIPISDLIGSGKQQRRMDEVPVEKVTEYAAEDADVPLRLASILEPRLRDEGLYTLFAELEMPLVEVLAEMEFNGIRIDASLLAELSQRFGRRLQELEQEIHELAGGPFHIESRVQLSQVLFEKLGLPIVKRTKTGPSTDADVLAELAKQHELPAKIVEYRQFAKLKSTYVDALPQLIHPQTGRVHTSLRQDVAATRVGDFSRPITPRSSCGCWPISRATWRCSRRSPKTATYTPKWRPRCTECRSTK